MRIAFLGLGAMGARMTARLCAAGHEVTAWNRSEGRAIPEGAARAATPADAARNAELVFSMVRDDEASRDIWLGKHGALATMIGGAIGVECSTLSLPYVNELAAAFGGAHRPFLDAPVAGSRPQAETGQLIFFVGGPAPAFEAARPVLEAMGGAFHHAGHNGAGALAKLMVNALFGSQLAMMGELIGLARRSGHDAARAVEIITATPVASPAVKLASAAMLGNTFPPAFPIDLVEKDFGLVAESAAALGAKVPLGETVRAIYAAAVKEGHGADNITGIVQRYAV